MAKVDKRLLKLHKAKKIKYVQKPMFGGSLLHPKTKKPIKFTTLNLPTKEQSLYANLYNKGYISGNILGRGKITKKGLSLLKKKR